jgi:AraC-like DNA-binding protein
MRIRWPLALLSTVEITPHIAYRGKAPEWASDFYITPPFFTWWEVEEGFITVTTERGRWTASSGEWILLPHGVPRHQKIASGTLITSLSFRAVWPTGRPLLDIAIPLVGRSGDALVRDARAVCREVAKSTGTDGCPLVEREFDLHSWLQLRIRLLAFLAQIIRKTEVTGGGAQSMGWGDLRLDAIVSELRLDLRIGPLPYAKWRRQFGLSRSGIDRLARQLLHGSLRAHRDRLLEDELRRELVLGICSAKELAVQYGFFDQAHFSRWLRQRTGMTSKNLRYGSV